MKNTHTTPESLELAKLFDEMLNENIEYVVMEVSSHSLAMNRVYEIDLGAAAFTNLTHDHLDLHNTFEEYARPKNYFSMDYQLTASQFYFQ